ncbi:MAG: hypothetical protein PHQ36_02020 [Anaerolineales bacterium]|nr:hypothetical protein [Anaerolineales bacterium]
MKEAMTYNHSMDQRTNNEWIADLRADGDRQAQALQDLYAIFVEGLPNALSGKLSPDDPEFETFVKSIAKKTIMHVLENLDTFEGHSAFITWALKLVIRQALYDLRSKRWQGGKLGDGFPEVPSSMYNELECKLHAIYTPRF